MRSPGLGMSLTVSSSSHRCVAPAVSASRAKTIALPAAARSPARLHQVERRKHAVHARSRVYAKHRHAIRPFDEFHRRGPPRIDLDCIRNAVADDEVDAVEADERELGGHVTSQIRRRARHRVVQDRIIGGRQHVAAVSISRCATRLVTNQLTREAERHGAPARGDEHDRGRDAVDALLRVVADRDARAGKPSPDALSSSGTEWLQRATRRALRVGETSTRVIGVAKPRRRRRPASRNGSRTRRRTSGGFPQSARPSGRALATARG